MTLINDLRLDSGDDDGVYASGIPPQRYSDEQYVAFMVKAGRRINRILSLRGTTSEIVINASTGQMTSPNNPDLEDIVLLQAECLVVSRDINEELTEGGAGLVVTDGEQSINTSSAAGLRGKFMDSSSNPCNELDKAILLYKYNGLSGKMVY